MSTYVLCLAYVDPLEEKDSSSEDFIYMLKAMISEMGVTIMQMV